MNPEGKVPVPGSGVGDKKKVRLSPRELQGGKLLLKKRNYRQQHKLMVGNREEKTVLYPEGKKAVQETSFLLQRGNINIGFLEKKRTSSFREGKREESKKNVLH